MKNKKLDAARAVLIEWAVKAHNTRAYREDFGRINEAVREIEVEAGVITVKTNNPLYAFVRACIDNLQEYRLNKYPMFRIEYRDDGGVREYVNAGYLTDLIARALFVAYAAGSIEE